MKSIRVVYNEKVISTTTSGALKIKISETTNNGLSFNGDNKITATKGKNGSNGQGGTMNYPGNGIVDNGTNSSGGYKAIPVIGCNSTVSRHVPADKNASQFVKDNDGVIMVATKITGENGSVSSIDDGNTSSIAYKIIHNTNSGGDDW